MRLDKETESVSFLSHILSEEEARKARVREAANNPNPLFPVEDNEKFDPEEDLEPDEIEEDVDQDSRVISRVKGQNKPMSVSRSGFDDVKLSEEPVNEVVIETAINQVFKDGSTSSFKPEYQEQLTRSMPWEVRDEDRLKRESERDLKRAIQEAGITLDESSLIRLGVYVGSNIEQVEIEE